MLKVSKATVSVLTGIYLVRRLLTHWALDVWERIRNTTRNVRAYKGTKAQRVSIFFANLCLGRNKPNTIFTIVDFNINCAKVHSIRMFNVKKGNWY